MTEEAKRAPKDPVLDKFARALWKSEKGSAVPKGEERRQLWKTDRKEATKKARRLMRQLEKNGVAMSVK